MKATEETTFGQVPENGKFRFEYGSESGVNKTFIKTGQFFYPVGDKGLKFRCRDSYPVWKINPIEAYLMEVLK